MRYSEFAPMPTIYDLPTSRQPEPASFGRGIYSAWFISGIDAIEVLYLGEIHVEMISHRVNL